MDELASRTWWVAGSPCAGKSTVMQRLANELEARAFSCDDAFEWHAARSTGPVFQKVTTWSPERRLNQPIDQQVQDVFTLAREQWPMIVADLQQWDDRTVVEGAALLPEALSALGVPHDRAVWIVPNEQFQRACYAKRSWARDLVQAARNPEESFDRWMQRDARFAEAVAEQAVAHQYPVVVTNQDKGVDQLYSEVRDVLGLSS